MSKFGSLILATALIAVGSSASFAGRINTGGENGAYHSKFCPLVSGALKDAQFNYACRTSEGSRANIQRVADHPLEIGFAQADIYAREIQLLGGQANFQTIRRDLGRECLFMVTKNSDIATFGDVVRQADQLNFVLPPENSGSSGTFEFLRQIDETGFGKAKSIIRADTTDTAIDAVLNSQDSSLITIFVQFPDPANTRFKRVADAKGRFIPVIDRNILRQEVAGEKIYFAQKTDVKNPNWLKLGEKVVTACTPLVLFTGHPDLLPRGTSQSDHKDLVRTINDMDVSELQPKEGFFTALFRKTKEISAKTVEAIVDMSDKAREKAGPVMERAGEASKNAIEKAKELGTEAMERAGELTERAKEKAGEMLENNR